MDQHLNPMHSLVSFVGKNASQNQNRSSITPRENEFSSIFYFLRQFIEKLECACGLLVARTFAKKDPWSIKPDQ